MTPDFGEEIRCRGTQAANPPASEAPITRQILSSVGSRLLCESANCNAVVLCCAATRLVRRAEANENSVA